MTRTLPLPHRRTLLLMEGAGRHFAAILSGEDCLTVVCEPTPGAAIVRAVGQLADALTLALQHDLDTFEAMLAASGEDLDLRGVLS